MPERVISYDTETAGLSWWDPAEQAFLATWADDKGEYLANLSNPSELKRFTDALEQADRVVCHNAAFDIHQLRATTGFDVLSLEVPIDDTDLLARVLFPEGQSKGGRGGFGLKRLAAVYVRGDAGDAEKALEELAKQIGHKTLRKAGVYRDLHRAYPEALEHYALEDARITYDLWQRFQEELTDDGAKRCYELEQAVMPVLIRAEAKGVRVDQTAVQKLKGEYEAQRDQAEDYLKSELGEEALGGPGSEEALLDALQKLGVPLHRKTDTGKLATHQFALQEFEDDFEALGVLSDFRQANKFLSTYIEPMVGRDVVHPSFMQCGAWTGRMSCRRPNLQNLPKRAGKKVRAVFVPRPDHAFVAVDYDSIEARLLAYYLGDETYRQLYEDGHDPHAWMASNVWGGEPSDYFKGTDGEPQRDDAKNVTYAICYGAGAPRVSDMLKCERREAKSLISKIKSSLPGYYRLNDRIRKKVEASGHVTTLFGRRQPVNKEKAYVGLNALIQGSAADVLKAGLVKVDEAVKDLSGVPLLVVHDECVVEVPIENAEECYRRVCDSMIAAYELSPSLAVSGSIVTTSYADA